MPEVERLLIVDDDSSMRMALYESLTSCGYEVETAENGAEALARFKSGRFAGVVTDMRMPKMSGMEVLKGVKRISPETPVIIITAYGTVSTAVDAMKEGASEFIMKPFSLDDLEFAVKNVLATGTQSKGEKKGVTGEAGYPGREIITQNQKIIDLLEMLKTVAASKSSVLIEGESGTGKELFARFVYRHSTRRQMPFVAVNCAAIPSQLLESEMFGYEKGAFTGAAVKKIGKFELADGGTLLLDEISEMDIHLQAKLLRVIQESEVDRLGGKMPVAIDVRLIATTNADILGRIEQKTFRSDLYYRLNVIPVKVPPLRERGGDILLLADHFIRKYSEVNEKETPKLSEQAKAMLNGYHWPGNVRELENIIERAVVISKNGRIMPADLLMDFAKKRGVSPTSDDQQIAQARQEIDAEAGTTLQEMEKKMIFSTLDQVNWNKTKASRILGISVRTMRNKLSEYGVKDKAEDN